MTVYESLIKVAVGDPQARRERDIIDGLSYTVVILIDEYGYSLTRIEDVLDGVRQEAEDRWYDLHPSESEVPGDG